MITQHLTDDMLNSIDPVQEGVREVYPNAEVFGYRDNIVVDGNVYRKPDIADFMPFDKYAPLEIWIDEENLDIQIKRIFP